MALPELSQSFTEEPEHLNILGKPRINVDFRKRVLEAKDKSVKNTKESIDQLQVISLVKKEVSVNSEAEIKKRADELQAEINRLSADDQQVVIPGTNTIMQAQIFQSLDQQKILNKKIVEYKNILFDPNSAVGKVFSSLTDCAGGLACLFDGHAVGGFSSSASGFPGANLFGGEQKLKEKRKNPISNLFSNTGSFSSSRNSSSAGSLEDQFLSYLIPDFRLFLQNFKPISDLVSFGPSSSVGLDHVFQLAS